MLNVARQKVPNAEFLLRDLHALRLPSDSVDLVVCSLALTHVADLDKPFAEFARVLRSGGQTVVSNIHHLSLPLGGVVEMQLPSGRLVRLPASLSCQPTTSRRCCAPASTSSRAPRCRGRTWTATAVRRPKPGVRKPLAQPTSVLRR
jgi:SAM-dependent methyltransferase